MHANANHTQTAAGQVMSDDIERASCGHMVQSNHTCGMYGCPNYGKS